MIFLFLRYTIYAILKHIISNTTVKKNPFFFFFLQGVFTLVSDYQPQFLIQKIDPLFNPENRNPMAAVRHWHVMHREKLHGENVGVVVFWSIGTDQI